MKRVNERGVADRGRQFRQPSVVKDRHRARKIVLGRVFHEVRSQLRISLPAALYHEKPFQVMKMCNWG
jgi:hypothetical protein